MTTPRTVYKIDQDNPGSDLAGETAAALAAASMAFRPVDPAYADTLLGTAVELFQFANQYRGLYSDSVPTVSSGKGGASNVFESVHMTWAPEDGASGSAFLPDHFVQIIPSGF